jgi:D-arabinose 1-dehydrogenase-like Zn-dependent alcohol dehydrogenase
MRVALVRELGGIGSVELRERPDPTPEAGQALIRVRGAGVGPWDVEMISGAFGQPALPYVPGFEVAGVVEAVTDGVDVRPGDRVWACLPGGGGFAEYAVAGTNVMARMPERLSFEEAAGLVVGGGTAWDGLVDHGQLRSGETVLITAAAGGVGSAAVQITAAMEPERSPWPAHATVTTFWAWALATCSTITPATGSSRCATWFPAASTSSSTHLAARPVIRPSAPCARAAGRSFWSVLRPS